MSCLLHVCRLSVGKLQSYGLSVTTWLCEWISQNSLTSVQTKIKCSTSETESGLSFHVISLWCTTNVHPRFSLYTDWEGEIEWERIFSFFSSVLVSFLFNFFSLLICVCVCVTKERVGWRPMQRIYFRFLSTNHSWVHQGSFVLELSEPSQLTSSPFCDTGSV